MGATCSTREAMKNVYTVLAGRNERNKPFARPTSKWWAHGNTVINRQLPYNAGKFLYS